MARSLVYIGVDLLPDKACFVSLGAKGEVLSVGLKPFESPETWYQTIAEIIAEVPLGSKLVWGIAPSFASGVSRSFFVPVEAKSVSAYVRWEMGLYLGVDKKNEYVLSWDKAAPSADGRMVHAVAVRYAEMQAFAASLERVGGRPALVDSRLFAAVNDVESVLGAQAPESYALVVEEGSLLRLAFCDKGSVTMQGQTLFRPDSAAEKIAAFVGRAPRPAERVFVFADEWFDAGTGDALREALGVPVDPMPLAEGISATEALAWSVANRCREGAL